MLRTQEEQLQLLSLSASDYFRPRLARLKPEDASGKRVVTNVHTRLKNLHFDKRTLAEFLAQSPYQKEYQGFSLKNLDVLKQILEADELEIGALHAFEEYFPYPLTSKTSWSFAIDDHELETQRTTIDELKDEILLALSKHGIVQEKVFITIAIDAEDAKRLGISLREISDIVQDPDFVSAIEHEGAKDHALSLVEWFVNERYQDAALDVESGLSQETIQKHIERVFNLLSMDTKTYFKTRFNLIAVRNPDSRKLTTRTLGNISYSSFGDRKLFEFLSIPSDCLPDTVRGVGTRGWKLVHSVLETDDLKPGLLAQYWEQLQGKGAVPEELQDDIRNLLSKTFETDSAPA